MVAFGIARTGRQELEGPPRLRFGGGPVATKSARCARAIIAVLAVAATIAIMHSLTFPHGIMRNLAAQPLTVLIVQYVRTRSRT